MRLILLYVLVSISLYSQPDIEKLTIDDGLSQNYVFDIIQDSRGFLWFGTKDGLNRYDGYSVRVYRSDPFDSLSLSDNTVTVLFEDQHHDLWIGTNSGGLNIFDRNTETFRRVPLPTAPNSFSNAQHILSISGTSDGNIWVGTYSGAFFFDRSAGTVVSYLNNPSDRNSLPSNEVGNILDEQDTVWFATGLGVSYLVKKSGTIVRIDDRTQDEQKNKSVTFIFRDSRRRLLIGRRLGLFWLDNGAYIPVVKADNTNGAYWSTGLREDRNGTLWLSTASTLSTISPDLEHIDRKITLAKERFTRGLTVDRSGVVWAGTSGLGAFINKSRQQRFGKHEGNYLSDLYPREIATIDSFFRREKIPLFIELQFRGANFYSAIEGEKGNVWFLTPYGLFDIRRSDQSLTLYRTNPKEYIHSRTWSTHLIDRLHDGTIVIGTVGGINFLDRKNGTFSHVRLYPDTTISADVLNTSSYHDITAIAEDTHGIVWCGTPGMGLIRYDRRSGSIRYFSHDAQHHGTISNNHVLTIHADPYEPDSVLWIGTEGGGLNRLNTAAGIFTSVTTDDGLPNNVVYGILEDAQKNFWMSTNDGLVKFDPKLKRIAIYDKEDGLQSNEFNRNEYYRSKNGTLIFGGIYGYNAFRPEEIIDNTVVPEIVLTDFRLFNKSVSVGGADSPLQRSITETDSVTLEYSQNMFSIQFAALDFHSPKKNRYKYMLEGFDHQWIVSPPSRLATYTNLDPGTYVFHVIASNNDNVWNEKGKRLTITILPPFYLTWWFKGIVSLIFILLGPAIYFMRVSQLKKERHRQEEVSRMFIQRQEQERSRIAQELHDSLGQELLIIKNRALLGLKTAGHDSKTEQQLKTISESASLVIKQVREISHGLRPPELDRLGLTETLRSVFSNVNDSGALDVTAEIEMIDGLIPAEQEINIVRIIQELVANVLRHSGAVTLTAVIRKLQGHIEIVVADNGTGFDSNASAQRSGLGLAGIHERVRILNGTIQIASEKNNGTTTTIILPIV
ncbi:MAG: two-component regulator propeller domain-containing protein [Bacteroidota bacterium]